MEETEGTEGTEGTEKTKRPKELSRMLTIRLSDKEKEMTDILRESPYCINISKYIRASIEHLYKVKTSKVGRAK